MLAVLFCFNFHSHWGNHYYNLHLTDSGNEGSERGSDRLKSHSKQPSRPLLPQHVTHLGVGVVCTPGGAESLLPPYVPYEEVSLPQNDLLHVATDGGRCVDHLIHQAGEGEETTKSSAHSAPSSGSPSPLLPSQARSNSEQLGPGWPSLWSQGSAGGSGTEPCPGVDPRYGSHIRAVSPNSNMQLDHLGVLLKCRENTHNSICRGHLWKIWDSGLIGKLTFHSACL